MHIVHKLFIPFLFIALVFVPITSPAKDSAIIVFDGSGSMWGQIEGKTKIEIARDVMNTVVSDWNEDIDLGLMVYGHRKKGSCDDIELVVPVASPDGEKVIDAVKNITPKGKTPISSSLQKAAEKLRYTEDPATVILISDGEESCSADPCVVSKELEEKGILFTAHVIGFDVKKNKKAQDQLNCIAENTGGQFFEAEDATELQEALKEVKQEVEQQVEKKKPSVKSGVTLKALDPESKNIVSKKTEWTIINLANEKIVTKTSDKGKLNSSLDNGDYEVFVTVGGKTGETKISISDQGEKEFEILMEKSESDKPFDLPDNIVAGQVIEFDWKGPNNKDDMIFIFKAGRNKNKYPLNDERRHRVANGKPGRLTAPARPGKYEIRYYSYDNGATLSKMEIDVKSTNAEITVPDNVAAGSKFSLSWTETPNSPDDMIFVSKKGMDNNRYFYDNRLSPRKGRSGSLVAPAEPGQYEVRYYSYNNGDVLVRVPLKVTESDVTLEAPRTVAPGTQIEVKWTGPRVSGDLVFIAETGMEENRYYYSGGRSANTSGGSPVTLTVPAKAGTYEIRYYSKANGKPLAKRALIVR